MGLLDCRRAELLDRLEGKILGIGELLDSSIRKDGGAIKNPIPGLS